MIIRGKLPAATEIIGSIPNSIRWQRYFCMSSKPKDSLNQFSSPFLSKCAANYAPLTPLSMFKRTVLINPNAAAYVHAFKAGNQYDEISRTWSEVGKRVARFASALITHCNILPGDVVSIIAPNASAIFEAHFAVPGAAAVLHTINTRLDAATIAYQLRHCHAKVVLVDSEYSSLMKNARQILQSNVSAENMPMFIDIVDVETLRTQHIDKTSLMGSLEFEDLLSRGDDSFQLRMCPDEFDAITLNYTSGTTGNPKGVVTHYRGAYLNSLSNQIELNIAAGSKYLWVVPMFHCNGWCFPWTLANGGSTSFFLRQVRAETIFHLIESYGISYMGGAPITMNTMLSYPNKKKFSHPVKMMVAGAPPPPSLMDRFANELGVAVQTAYGLTETYGPISSYIPYQQGESSDVPVSQQRVYQVFNTTVEEMTVRDPGTMEEVPRNGSTMGEVMIRGNIVMKGYLNNEAATVESFKDGWFHTGDLGVMHKNGRVELKDRSKDIIISGGENISSIEVENIMATHPDISEVAVVAMPDEKWGEVPCAFVTLHKATDGSVSSDLTEAKLIQWCRTKMASFQSPKRVIFCDLPKTSTGKVQKAELRKLM